MTTPEELARQQIDQMLAAGGWAVQDRKVVNLSASRGVAIREFPLEAGFADYMLFVDRQTVAPDRLGLPVPWLLRERILVLEPAWGGGVPRLWNHAAPL